MKEEEWRKYRFIDIFYKLRSLVTAGTIDNFNSCTIGWGSVGNIWAHYGEVRPTLTIYIFPTEYTYEFLKANKTFTVSFFPKKYNQALSYMGSHSGRDEDKVKAAGLTPREISGGITYCEASLVFVCKKLYCSQPDKKDLQPEIRKYYRSMPEIYPPDLNGNLQAHVIFMGEVIKAIDNRLCIGDFYPPHVI